jgi:hypothetical protein
VTTLVQAELVGLPEPSASPAPPAEPVTERTMLDALHRRYGQHYGNGPRYAVAEHVRSHAGFSARRTADFVAMDLWSSRGMEMHGHEVKVSRSDLLTELKHPEKAEEFIPYMNRWWLVVSDPRIIRDGELPAGWGLLALAGRELRIATHAPRREALLLPPTRLAGLLRAVQKTARERAR